MFLFHPILIPSELFSVRPGIKSYSIYALLLRLVIKLWSILSVTSATGFLCGIPLIGFTPVYVCPSAS